MRDTWTGVPQDSVLGPLLFLLYINDLSTDLKCSIKLFADKTSLFTVFQDPNTAASDMNHDLNPIGKWARDWSISFNPDPQKEAVEMILSTKGNEIDHPIILFNKSPVVKVKEHELLGSSLDKKLSFSVHIKVAICKTREGIVLLKYLSSCLPTGEIL